MKTIFTLLFSSFFSLSLLAYDGSRLSISTVQKNPNFNIEVDGRRVNLRDNTITLSNISEGTHNIRIYKDKKNKYGFNKRQELIYAGSVFVRRGFHTDVTVNRFGKVFVDEVRMGRNENLDGEDIYQDEYEDEYGDVGSDWDPRYKNVISASDFNIVKDQVRREWSETNRVQSVKKIIDGNQFLTEQIRELMLLFTFENNRVEVAKHAFRKTVDNKNYYQLNDVLTLSSSKEDLARFIRQSR